MIEKFYAAHIRNTLDASAINVMRPKGAKGAKANGNGAAAKGAGKSSPLQLTVAQKAARKERGRQAARTMLDESTDTEV